MVGDEARPVCFARRRERYSDNQNPAEVPKNRLCMGLFSQIGLQPPCGNVALTIPCGKISLRRARGSKD
jgi:hypothetical protein